MNVDGLGNVVERRPWQVAATGVIVFVALLLVGVVSSCEALHSRGTPPLLQVDAEGRPDWVWVGPTIAIILLGAAAGAGAVVKALRSAFRVDPEHAGVRLERLGETRFVPYADVTGVAVEGTKLAVAVRSHGSFRISTRMGNVADVRELRDEIVRRMTKARAEPPPPAVLPPAPEHDDEPLLAPGGRSVARWLRDLHAMAGDAGYRGAATSAERMWRVVENGDAASAVRAAAAIVLAAGSAGERAVHDRLHAIASACEDNHLRVALDRVARGAGDEDMRRALEPLCGER